MRTHIFVELKSTAPLPDQPRQEGNRTQREPWAKALTGKKHKNVQMSKIDMCEYEQMRLCLSVCLSVCPSACLPACLPACPSVCQSVSLSVCAPACVSVCLSVWMDGRMAVWLAAWLAVCYQSVSLSDCLSV